MRFRNTLILALLLLGLGAYLYFVESKQIAEGSQKAKLRRLSTPDDVTARHARPIPIARSRS